MNETKTIDYVVPMVFPDDPEWRKVLRKAQGKDYEEMDSDDTVRYRSWDTEELLIRCVRKFMPWVRDIIILLAQESQRQPWMDGYGIRVVYHRDFMPAKHLPTFNSRAMEMYLHKIPGLSDCFLYGNDDMFPLSPQEETDFFRNGLPCQFYMAKTFPERPNQFHKACLNGLNFVGADYNLHYVKIWLKNGHGISPILKEVCTDLWKRHPKEMDASVTPFRQVRNFNQYIYGWEQHFSGRYFAHIPLRRYIGVGKVPVEKAVRIIAEPDCGIVCINDNEARKDITAYAEAVRQAIEDKLK